VELRDFLRTARKRWWWLVTSVTAAVALAGAITLQTPPEYATTVTFFISTPNQGVTDVYQGSLFSQERVKSYANLLSGDRLATTIAGDSTIGLTSDEVQARIVAETIPDTVLLQATVTDQSKDRCRRIADALAVHFETLVESLETPPGSSDSTVKVAVVAGPRLNESSTRARSPRARSATSVWPRCSVCWPVRV
jgi:capsular polysaccharide biosynthesis protein